MGRDRRSANGTLKPQEGYFRVINKGMRRPERNRTSYFVSQSHGQDSDPEFPVTRKGPERELGDSIYTFTWARSDNLHSLVPRHALEGSTETVPTGSSRLSGVGECALHRSGLVVSTD